MPLGRSIGGEMQIWAACVGVMLGVGCLLCVLWDTCYFGIGMLSTSRAVRGLCCQILASQPVQGRLVDLGAGLGSTARGFARACPQLEVRAIEGSRLADALARLADACVGMAAWVRRRSRPRVHYERGDFMDQHLGAAQVVYCYLCHRSMPAVAAKLRRELQPGALVLSNTFAMPGWRPLRVDRASDLLRTPVYLYRA